MDPILIFIIFIAGVLFGIILGWLVREPEASSRKAAPRKVLPAPKIPENSQGGAKGRAKNLSAYNLKRMKIKAERKAKIMNLVKIKGKITNNDVQKLLNLADSTATDYLDELEKEGKIIQQGKVGRSVVYVLVGR